MEQLLLVTSCDSPAGIGASLRTDEQHMDNGWTDRRDVGNSILDKVGIWQLFWFEFCSHLSMFGSILSFTYTKMRIEFSDFLIVYLLYFGYLHTLNYHKYGTQNAKYFKQRERREQICAEAPFVFWKLLKLNAVFNPLNMTYFFEGINTKPTPHIFHNYWFTTWPL